jgi:hypothetical protein
MKKYALQTIKEMKAENRAWYDDEINGIRAKPSGIFNRAMGGIAATLVIAMVIAWLVLEAMYR